MSKRQPLRFLGALVGGWIAIRVAVLAPGWAGEDERTDQPVRKAPPTASAANVHSAARTAELAAPVAVIIPLPATAWRAAPASVIAAPVSRAVPQNVELAEATPIPSSHALQSPQLGPAASMPQMLVRPTHPVAPPSRWSASTWAFVRRGDEPALASGGTLGGSQIGATASYRINGNSARPLAIAARLYSPLRRRQGAEAALGLSWRPLARIPVTIMAERREALGSEGRSAFSLLAHGGVSSLPVGPFRIDAYGQAGIVGINSRDLFADGAATAGIPLGSTENIIAGAGLWGAAQPGASRVDVGPSVTVRLPVQDRSVRVSADWRFRVAGGAAPGSGPSLTIGTDF